MEHDIYPDDTKRIVSDSLSDQDEAQNGYSLSNQALQRSFRYKALVKKNAIRPASKFVTKFSNDLCLVCSI
jgi:hypothetical protein